MAPQAGIVGVTESDLGRIPDKTVLQLQAARAALADAGRVLTKWARFFLPTAEVGHRT